ncbi:MAG: hypothetical protein LUC97_09635 [Clostridiales bacterium]|nr:hypothetical protein [Clostridiales bacterium]MCD8215882.1 hypothetical protein [Clostridiales bacterium]
MRAVGEAAGKEVGYDANNNIVYIGGGTNTSSGYVQNQGTALTAYNTLEA